MNEDRPYWDMEMEPLLNTPEMEKIQFERLKKTLVRMKANAPFFTKMMEAPHLMHRQSPLKQRLQSLETRYRRKATNEKKKKLGFVHGFYVSALFNSNDHCIFNTLSRSP